MEAKIALVTGGNRGLGLGFVEVLAEQLRPDGLVYLGARDLLKGREAADRLVGKGLQVAVLELDISRDDSVSQAAEALRGRHGGVDIVIGNAAMVGASRSAAADLYFNTNNFGTNRLIREFGPLLKDGARFLIVSSCHGVLTGAPGVTKAPLSAEKDAKLRAAAVQAMQADPSLTISDAIRDRMMGENATLQDIEAALLEYCALRESGTAVAHGWPEWINKASKFAQIASMMVFARQMESEARERDILINACCPGLVATAATSDGSYGDLSISFSPREAAESLTWIVNRPAGDREPYGRMLFHQNVEAVF